VRLRTGRFDVQCRQGSGRSISSQGFGVELADAEADLLLFLVDAEHDGLDFLADGEDIGRTGDALGPGELGDVDEAFDAFFHFDECAVGARAW